MKPEENIWSSLGFYLLSLPMEDYLVNKCRNRAPFSNWHTWILIWALQLPMCIETAQLLPAHFSLTEKNLTNIKERKKKETSNL